MEDEQKIEKCPYCGGVCKTIWRHRSDDKHWAVTCYGCWYSSIACETGAEAIAAHNKVSNAVATQPELLEALEGLEEDWGADDCMCELPDICSICVARAAVLKAKGKSHG